MHVWTGNIWEFSVPFFNFAENLKLFLKSKILMKIKKMYIWSPQVDAMRTYCVTSEERTFRLGSGHGPLLAHGFCLCFCFLSIVFYW